jgi:hypothetical protein
LGKELREELAAIAMSITQESRVELGKKVGEELQAGDWWRIKEVNKDTHRKLDKLEMMPKRMIFSPAVTGGQ